MMKTNVKQISFSDQMMELAKRKMAELGIDFSEYIRHLIINDTRDLREKAFSMSDEVAKKYSDIKKAYKTEEYVSLRDAGEIKEYIREVMKEDKW